MTTWRFALQFHPSEILTLAKKYGYGEDDDALAAGKKIEQGDHSKSNLKVIIEWKSHRIAGLIDGNTDAEIASALRFSCNAQTSERSAVDTLFRLRGVGIPVASAILAMVDPNRYTIIDFRALESLGIVRSEDSLDFYLEYLRRCREIAREHGVDLRTLDRALWQWSKDHGPARPVCQR